MMAYNNGEWERINKEENYAKMSMFRLECLYGEKCEVEMFDGTKYEGEFRWTNKGLADGVYEIATENGTIQVKAYKIKHMKFM